MNTTPDAIPAYLLWIELATRITSQRLHYRSGNEEAAAKSVASLFRKVRGLLEEHPQATEFRAFALTLINVRMRPYTARWDGWMTQDSVLKDKDGDPVRHFRDEQVRRQFRAELQMLQADLAKAQKSLASMAGVTDCANGISNEAGLGGKLKAGIGGQVIIKKLNEKDPDPATSVNQAEHAAILERRRVRSGAQALDAELIDAQGLALSGGGIRSATFCLGVLQVLADKKLLPQFDYVSTVSGGGYLGSFLSCSLGTVPTPQEKGSDPQAAVASINARFEDIFERKGKGTESGLIRHLRNNSKYLLNGGIQAKLEIVGLLISGILWNVLMILPIPLVGVLLVCLLNKWEVWGEEMSFGRQPLPAFETFAGRTLACLAGALAAFWVLLPLVQLLNHGKKPGSPGAIFRRGWERITLAIGVMVCLAGLFFLLPAAFHAYEKIRNALSQANIPGLGDLPDWAHASFAGAGSVLLGLLSAWIKPHWPRLRSVAVKLFILSGPLLFLWVFLLVGNRTGLASQPDDPWPVATVFSVTLVLVLWGWLCVNINTLAPHRYYRSKLCECYLARRAGGVTAPTATADGSPSAPAQSGGDGSSKAVPAAHKHLVPRTRTREFFTGEYVDGRTESLQQVRLTDLGASVAAPYHLINTTLNLPASDNKELRGRNGDFFVVTRDFCGSPLVGYLPTAQVEKLDPHFDLGTAMAVSAAAASTSMGWKSLPHFRFLMTLFNVRLGYWIRRPGAKSLSKLLEGAGPYYLFREMLGTMNERCRYLNLSDGGHIENLAAYELLRRKCKFIVCVDAGQEPGMECADLVRLQRYASIDLGIEMGFSLKDVALQSNGFSRAYAILVKIDYPPDSAAQPGGIGWMLYVKLAMTGIEPPYVSDYKRENPLFPHESTADQFYDEAQFEAYRMLGECAADNLFRNELMERSAPATLRDWFQQLADKLLPDNDPVFHSPACQQAQTGEAPAPVAGPAPMAPTT